MTPTEFGEKKYAHVILECSLTGFMPANKPADFLPAMQQIEQLSAYEISSRIYLPQSIENIK